MTLLNPVAQRAANDQFIIPILFNELFELYSAGDINEILLNTLYMAVSNPNLEITRQELFESVQAITKIAEILRKVEKTLPNCA